MKAKAKALKEFNSWPKWKKEITIGPKPVVKTTRVKSQDLSRTELVKMIADLRGLLYVAVNIPDDFIKDEARKLLNDTSFDIDE